MGEPTFKLRKKLLARGYYVIARWNDGSKTKVGRFGSRSDAERWMQHKAKDWLAERLKAPAPSRSL